MEIQLVLESVQTCSVGGTGAVYPIPLCYWKTLPPQKCRITLADLEGQVLLSKTVDASTPWPLPPVQEAIYFLKVEWSDGPSAHRLWID